MAQPAAKPADKPMTSADVCAAISGHFGHGERYAVLFEVRNAAGFNANRSIDAVVMSLWPSLGLELWGMEIKVNRYDWTRELNNPKKASDVFHHFDRWFLVAPDGVAKSDEIPGPWGWFIPSKDGRLQRAREAAKNPDVKPLDRQFLAMLMRQTARKDGALIESAVNNARTELRQQMNAEIDHRALERLGDLKKDAEQWQKVRELLKQKPDDYIYQPDVIECLRVLIRSGVAHSHGGLQSLITEVDRIQATLAKIRDDFGLEKPKEKKRA